MIEIERDMFKSDIRFEVVYEIIKKNHQVASHTKKVLYANRKIKNFCEEARHFVVIGKKLPIYLHYDVSSWYHNKSGALIKIERIAFYDNFNEYESARLRGLHSTEHQDGISLN